MSGINLGLRTAAEVRKIAEDGMAETQRAVRMLCDELQMHEASYEILREERNRLLAKVMEREAEIKRLKLDIDGWKASSDTWRKACISSNEVHEYTRRERDDARREVCELEANGSLEAGTPTTVAADRDWSYLYGKEVVK